MTTRRAKASHAVHTFTVCGSLPFPLDMLRYDCCWPYSLDDGEAIEASLKRQAPGEVTVRLARAYPTAGQIEPTRARWQSFGWIVNP